MTAIPSYPAPSLSREQVISFLVPCIQRGWEIYTGKAEDQFIFRLAENLKLFIEQTPEGWRVSTGLAPSMSISIWAYPETTSELTAAVAHALSIVTHAFAEPITLDAPPRSIRLKASEPASNLSKMCALIGSSSINAIFDTYLENKSLEALLNMSTLGVRISRDLRLLTSSSMTQAKSVQPRLTSSYFTAWTDQLALHNCILRHRDYKGHQRRFLLLSGGTSLILGPSLNNLNVNEASHVENDSADLALFEQEWAQSSNL